MFTSTKFGRSRVDDIQCVRLARLPRASVPRPDARKSRTSGPSRALRADTDSLATLLARSSSLTDVLPQLHRQVLSATSGRCSLLFEQNVRNGTMLATSATGLPDLPSEPWIPDAREAAVM